MSALPEEISACGVALAKELEDKVLQVSLLVEKPTLEEAPSNLSLLVVMF